MIRNSAITQKCMHTKLAQSEWCKRIEMYRIDFQHTIEAKQKKKRHQEFTKLKEDANYIVHTEKVDTTKAHRGWLDCIN